MSSPSTTNGPSTGLDDAASRAGVVCFLLRGGLGFAVVSVAAFAAWAFGGKWFSQHGGEGALYLGCAVVFIGLSGVVMHPLVCGPGSLGRFYKIFVPAFVAYAVVWSAAWFALHFGAGEWAGSLAGSIAFVAMVGYGFKNFNSFVAVAIVMFTCHSSGYFLGGKLMYWLGGPGGHELFSSLSKSQIAALAKLSWGLLYGLGFGAGLGFAFYKFQEPRSRPALSSATS